MNITEIIAEKEKELETVAANHQKLWLAMNKAQEEWRSEFQDPWHAAYERKEKLQQEVNALKLIQSKS